MIVSNGRRKLHYLYPDKTELVEELDLNTNEVLVRKWKRPIEKGMPSQEAPEWEFEIGEEVKPFNPETTVIAVSDQNPQCKRKDTKERFEWRIRNLPYPKETYIVEVDHQKQQIVLKTTNKKYYCLSRGTNLNIPIVSFISAEKFVDFAIGKFKDRLSLIETATDEEIVQLYVTKYPNIQPDNVYTEMTEQDKNTLQNKVKQSVDIYRSLN